MAEKDEFRIFIRDIGIRAFDQFASQFAPEQGPRVTARMRSLSRLASCWNALRPAEKELFFEQMISAAQAAGTTAPGKATKKRKSRKD